MTEPDIPAQIMLNLPVLVLGITFILGAIIGSFLNVVVYRLPVMLHRDYQSQAHEILETSPEQPEPTERFNLVLPNSHCPVCKYEIKPWENIPILSYLFLGGHCSNCGTSISIRYLLVELFTGLLSCAVVTIFGPGLTGLSALVFTWCLISLSLIDFDQQILPDQMTLPLMWLGLMVNYTGMFTDFGEAFWGAVAGYLTLWLVYWVFKLVTKKEGMGYGDFKLLAALGAWLGWQSIPMIIILSSLSGSLIGGVLILLGRDKDIPISFGPYLATAGFITLLWGHWIISQYDEWFLSGVS